MTRRTFISLLAFLPFARWAKPRVHTYYNCPQMPGGPIFPTKETRCMCPPEQPIFFINPDALARPLRHRYYDNLEGLVRTEAL